ncbi:DeoR/GlpR family DNA-binding transcription regulator [Allorhizobium borbori]|uniref:DeoR family glycerol-3-phosphate regulon repressor n=1 Tax=Allorhizobium borbori TaxID=485907 RepID=A0A7W6K5V2_9HYPH|nr:DeoR/GlpR family DNA-binding transcription regulator [Allorhizobium borbori]MBB4105685.1 DeoR family glycerol-3-phosphate regulon repressor [Allorhizobium borbori]PZU24144.1 MAG: DeoR/GlpR transcriptional regulator [Shinella sp.]
MQPSKRHRDIFRLLERDGTIAISELARVLDVSLETIRRDIKPLVDEGSVMRLHGAVSLPSEIGEAPFEKRMRENSEAKKAIAAAVAATIRDGDSIMLDTGTSTSFLARELHGHRRLTVVTNSSDIARTLATVNGNRVYMAGGELRSDNGAAFGSTAIEFINRFNVTHAVITAGAITPDGIADYDLEEAEFARNVLSRGKRRLVVTDHSKFSKPALVRVCGFDGITTLATNQPPPPDIAEAIQAAEAELLIA